MPTSSKRAALAALAMYTPCRSRAVWIHRVAWTTVSFLGPGALPGKSHRWRPPQEHDVWSQLVAHWREVLGHFDTVAVYERTQMERLGFMLLLIDRDRPVAFLKLHCGNGAKLHTEADAHRAAWESRPCSFRVPEPLALQEHCGWTYFASAPLPPRPHRMLKNAPVNLIVREINKALSDMRRPPDIPVDWQPMHGDFTPWNLRALSDGNVVLIDWGEVGWGPPGADEVLYRAAIASLSGEPPTASDKQAAIEFWGQQIKNRTTTCRRDLCLAHELLESLGQMRFPNRRSVLVKQNRPPVRVLIFAYACEPNMGSEPGAGWGLVRTIAEYADECVVLVASPHIQAIRDWEASHGSTKITFIEVSEPDTPAKWHRITWFILYLVWLRRAYKVARELHAERPFDVAFHSTYAVYWLPSPATHLGIPCIWGPVGGAVTTPIRLWPLLGWKGVLDELLDFACVNIASWWPLTRSTWRQATWRILQNEETRTRLPKRFRENMYVLNNYMFIDAPAATPSKRQRHILFLSELQSRKGGRLAIRALTHTSEDVRLLVVGDGPERGALERLAKKLNVSHRLEFTGQVSHDKVFDFMREAAAMVFPVFREEGGVALAEAMYCGTPVIIIANGGPLFAASNATDPERVVVVQPAGVEETTRRIGEAMTRFSLHPTEDSSPTLDPEPSRKILHKIIDDALALGTTKGH